MIIKNDDEVKIQISEEKLIRSMALMKDLRDYCRERTEEGTTETIEALTVAIETMIAFYAEHFEEIADD